MAGVGDLEIRRLSVLVGEAAGVQGGDEREREGAIEPLRKAFAEWARRAAEDGDEVKRCAYLAFMLAGEALIRSSAHCWRLAVGMLVQAGTATGTMAIELTPGGEAVRAYAAAWLRAFAGA